MADKLTIKQEKYAQGLFAGLSQREAYKEAFNCSNMTDKTVDEAASRLANDSKVIARIEQLTNELKERNMVTVEKVLAELAKVGFANGSDFARVIEKTYEEEIKDDDGNIIEIKEHRYKTVEVVETDKLDKDKLAAIAGIKATKDGIEVKTNDKIKALELMGRHLGMFTDKVDIKGEINNNNVNFDTDEARRKYLEDKLKEVEQRKK